jgi:hypothetical protein
MDVYAWEIDVFFPFSLMLRVERSLKGVDSGKGEW